MYHRTALNTVRLRVVGVDSKRVETRNFASLQSFREVNYLIRTVLGRVSYQMGLNEHTKGRGTALLCPYKYHVQSTGFDIMW